MSYYGGTVSYAPGRTSMWSYPDEELPRLAYNNGPAEFSTDTDLVPFPGICWDVNRYYRDLGIPWPYLNASKHDISKAYRENGGPQSARMTFCLKQLLNRKTKAEYDQTPLGGTFLDPYVLAAIKARVIAEVLRQGHSQEDVEALKQAFARHDIIADDTPEDGVDADSAEVQDDSCPARAVTGFPFSYYLWRSTCDNTDRLSRWQELLLTAFRVRKIKIRLSLGYLGRMPHRFSLGQVGTRPVAFVHEFEQPSYEVAEAIADRVQEIQRETPALLTSYK